MLFHIEEGGFNATTSIFPVWDLSGFRVFVC